MNKREKVGLDHLNDRKAFMEYSNDLLDVYKNVENYNPDKKRKALIVFDDLITDMINNKKLNSMLKTIVFIRQSYFKVPKEVRLNSTHFFIMKNLNKRELE